MNRIPRLYRWAAVAAAALGLVLSTALTAGATTAAPAFTVPAGAGVSTEIVLDAGGYHQCLNDRGQNTAAGAPVTIYSCGNGNAIANYWLTYPDNTIRPQLKPSMAVTVGTGNKLVLEPVAAAGATSAQVWFFRADGGIESDQSVAGQTEYLANSPQQSTANNTQQIVFNQSTVTTNAHWYLPKAHYATSVLSNRPDSASDGTNWSNDHISRASMVVYLGDATAGVHSFQGSVVDTGTFHALAGASQPNPSTAGAKLGDSLSGSIAGSTGYSFTSSAFVSRSPESAYSGSNPTTGNWPGLYFATGAVANGGLDNSGPVEWAWTYTSNKDNCKNTEVWVDAQYGEAGNITAPATCP